MTYLCHCGGEYRESLHERLLKLESIKEVNYFQKFMKYKKKYERLYRLYHQKKIYYLK